MFSKKATKIDEIFTVDLTLKEFPVFLLIKNPINRLCLHQFLETKTTEVNKLLKTEAY